MKILKRMAVRCVADEYMLIPLDEAVTEYKGLFVTTEVGARIWEYLCEDKDCHEIVQALAEEFDAPFDVIEKDYKEFLDLLFKHELIAF